MANKIRYGIKNVYYAIATIQSNGSATYGTPKSWPGAVSLTMDKEGDQEIFYADNIAYFISAANGGYSGSLESALIPDDFRENVLNELMDNNNVLIECVTAEPVHFALMFQFEGDQSKIQHVLYNCIASRPSVSGNTKEATVSPQTETIDIKALPVYNATLDADIVKARTSATASTSITTTWNSSVYAPTITM